MSHEIGNKMSLAFISSPKNESKNYKLRCLLEDAEIIRGKVINILNLLSLQCSD